MSVQVQETDRHAELDHLCRAAYQASYRWPASFGGFRAAITLAGPGWRAAGTVVAQAPGDVVVDLPGVDQAAWVTRQLCSLVAHRWFRPYESADGRWPKVGGSCSEHPLGTLIRLVGNPHCSSYRVLEGQFSQINREMNGRRLSVLIQQRDPAPNGRSVAVVYTASYWDTVTGRLLGSDAHLDRYTAVEGVLLPQRRRVISAQDGGLVLRELRLRDHTLLSSVGAEARQPVEGRVVKGRDDLHGCHCDAGGSPHGLSCGAPQASGVLLVRGDAPGINTPPRGPTWQALSLDLAGRPGLA